MRMRLRTRSSSWTCATPLTSDCTEPSTVTNETARNVSSYNELRSGTANLVRQLQRARLLPRTTALRGRFAGRHGRGSAAESESPPRRSRLSCP